MFRLVGYSSIVEERLEFDVRSKFIGTSVLNLFTPGRLSAENDLLVFDKHLIGNPFAINPEFRREYLPFGEKY